MPRFTHYGDKARWGRRVARERRRLERDPRLAVCWLCGDPIDMSLPPLHARAFTLDHIVPVARAGSLDGETRPAHRTCNSSRGKGRGTTATNTILDW